MRWRELRPRGSHHTSHQSEPSAGIQRREALLETHSEFHASAVINVAPHFERHHFLHPNAQQLHHFPLLLPNLPDPLSAATDAGRSRLAARAADHRSGTAAPFSLFSIAWSAAPAQILPAHNPDLQEEHLWLPTREWRRWPPTNRSACSPPRTWPREGARLQQVRTCRRR